MAECKSDGSKEASWPNINQKDLDWASWRHINQMDQLKLNNKSFVIKQNRPIIVLKLYVKDFHRMCLCTRKTILNILFMATRLVSYMN